MVSPEVRASVVKATCSTMLSIPRILSFTDPATILIRFLERDTNFFLRSENRIFSLSTPLSLKRAKWYLSVLSGMFVKLRSSRILLGLDDSKCNILLCRLLPAATHFYHFKDNGTSDIYALAYRQE